MKQKLFSILALLLMAATGAWAQGYTVTLKDGTEDADKWTISDGTKSADGATGLTGLSGTETVTVKYTGTKRVKSVTAVKKEVVKPDLLSGVFSVSASKKVNFSKGNLRYASGTWSFFDNQYDYYDSYSEDAWDHLGWSTSATTYGMNTSDQSSDYSGLFVDWGATMGTGWFTLSKDEWTYLFNTRSASTVGDTENGRYAKAKVNNVPGVIIFPDTYTHPDGVTAPTGVNATNNTGWNGNSYTVADWTKMESAGCVFLPVAGYRVGTTVEDPGTIGRYWSATLNGTGSAYCVHIASGGLNPAYSFTRYRGCSVRLVQAAPLTYPIALSAVTADYIGSVVTSDGNVNAYITGAGGAAISDRCWSATGYDDSDAWDFFNDYWRIGGKTRSRIVRPVLGF